MHINLLVIKTSKLHALAKQYSALGLQFDYHQHGNGPFHYASEINGLVFEIYPLPKSETDVSKHIRLGISVPNIKKTLIDIKDSSWIIKSALKQDRSYPYAILQDLDGRIIELSEA